MGIKIRAPCPQASLFFTFYHIACFNKKIYNPWSSHCGSAVTNPTSIHKDAGLIPGFAWWVKGSGVAVSCGVGRRSGLDPVLLWLWRGPATAALIQPLVWKLPYGAGAALKRQKKYDP